MQDGQSRNTALLPISERAEKRSHYKGHENKSVKELPVRKGRRQKIRVKLFPPKGLSLLTVCSRSGSYAPSR